MQDFKIGDKVYWSHKVDMLLQYPFFGIIVGIHKNFFVIEHYARERVSKNGFEKVEKDMHQKFNVGISNINKFEDYLYLYGDSLE